MIVKEAIEWISIYDSVPDDERSVLVCGLLTEGDDVPTVWVGYWEDKSSRWRLDNGRFAHEVAYWAEIPTGPEELA